MSISIRKNGKPFDEFVPTISLRKSLAAVRKAMRAVYNFDGVDDRGQLAFKAINIDGDNSFEFWTPENFIAEQAIITQCISGNFALMEFRLFSRTTPDLVITFGGQTNIFFTAGQGLKAATKYGLTLIGNQLQVFEGGLSGTLVRDTTFTRGAAREAAAITGINARNNSGTLVNFFRGRQYDVSINGTLYPMSEKGQLIQMPSPRGLGAEIVNVSSILWEAPASNRVVVDGGLSYTAQDTWGQRGFRIPITIVPNIPYMMEVDILSGYAEGQAFRLILNDKLGDGLPHVIPLKWPESTPFDTASTYYGSFTSVPISNGKARILFSVPNATNLNWFMSIRSLANQNNANISLRNISIKPLYTLAATQRVTNGDFSGGTTGWAAHNGGAIAVSDGQVTLSTVSGQPSRFERGVGLQAGKHYEASVDIVSMTVTQCSLSIIRGAAGNYASVASAKATAVGRLTFVFLAQAADALIQVYGDGVNAGTVVVDNVSVREITALCNPMQLANINPDRWEEIEGSVPKTRFVYDFDGVDDRGQLATKAVNPDGDNTFEFWTAPSDKSLGIIVGQSIAGAMTNREFQLWTSANQTQLNVTMGGVMTAIGSVTPATKYGLTLIGTTYTLMNSGGAVIRTGAFGRGDAREPAANTYIGANQEDAQFKNFYQGTQRDIKINGVLWKMDAVGSNTQPSIPAGNNMTLVNTNPDRWKEVLE